MLECCLETKVFSPFLSLKLNQTSDDPIIFPHTHAGLFPTKLVFVCFFFKQGIHMYLPEDVFEKTVSRRLNRLPGLLVHTKFYSRD